MKFKHAFSVLAAVVLLFSFSCQSRDPKLSGVWSSVGYGRQMIISDSTVALYDTFSGGCVLSTTISFDAFSEMTEVLQLSKNRLTIKVGLTNYEFTRNTAGTLPCNKQVVTNDPLSNFDALWNTFNENYSSFETRNTDWEEMREKYRPMLSKQSTDTELYMVLSQMISELHDGHVFLDAPDSVKNIAGSETGNQLADLKQKVSTHICSAYLDKVHSYNMGNLVWGTIDGNVGYIQINTFEDLANYGISADLPEDEFWKAYWEAAESSENYTNDVLRSFAGEMESVFKNLKNTDFCIIDLRFNNGGYDQAGL